MSPFLFSLLMLLPLPAAAQEAEIGAVIADQFGDFARDDFAGAFEHASPGIQGIFGSAENFGAMVRNGYPMVWRFQSFRMLDLREIAGSLWQRVEVIDAEGRLFHLDYKMIQGEGGWKVDAVQLIPAPPPAA